MSASPQVSAEVQRILRRKALLRRLLIGLVVVLFAAAFGITGWVMWQGDERTGGSAESASAAKEDPGPAGRPESYGTGVTTGSGSDPDYEADQDNAPAGDSFFDLQPGIGVEQESGDSTEAGEEVLRTGDVLEEIAGRRAMERADAGGLDVEGFARAAGERLNEILSASTAEEILPHIRHGEAMEPYVEAYLEREESQRLPNQVKLIGASMADVGGLSVLLLRLNENRFKEAAFIRDEESGEWLLDWESFVAFSTLGWEELRRVKPGQPVLVRGHAVRTEYYNFGFSDPSAHMVLRLDSPDNFHAIYGYIENDTPLAEEARTQLANGRVRPVLAIVRYPESAVADNQVLIEDVVAWRWLDVREAPSGQYVTAEAQ